MSTKSPPFRYSASPVRASTLSTGNTGQLERVREPQRQFVERHEPSARTLAAGLGSRHTLPRLTPSSATRDGQIDSKPVSTADRIARASPGM